jgi:hypothetical protein
MNDIIKIRELHVKTSNNFVGWTEWPYPTVITTSLITGDLKEKILKKIGPSDGTITDMFLVETYNSCGYSEYTQEDEYNIDVEYQNKVIIHINYEYTSEGVMAQFMRWVDQL